MKKSQTAKEVLNALLKKDKRHLSKNNYVQTVTNRLNHLLNVLFLLSCTKTIKYLAQLTYKDVIKNVKTSELDSVQQGYFINVLYATYRKRISEL